MLAHGHGAGWDLRGDEGKFPRLRYGSSPVRYEKASQGGGIFQGVSPRAGGGEGRGKAQKQVAICNVR